MPPPSKSKEPKKEAVKTNRRKAAATKAKGSASKMAAPAAPPAPPPKPVEVEGFKPEEVVEQLGKSTKHRGNTYEVLRGPMVHIADCFLRNLENNPRLPVPVNDRRRVKVDKDDEYLPAQYVKLEMAEYMFVQAPTKAQHKLFWRAVHQDQCKIIVCLCHDDQMSATDDSKCYTYFPTEVNQSIDVELKKGKFTILCKSAEGLSMGAMRYEMELTDSEAPVIDAAISDDPNAANLPKGLQFTLFHMNTWSGTRPETGNPFEQAQNVELFLREVNKAEVQVLRKSMENFYPPVVIQSFNGIGRASIAWVILMLMKDVEKRDCFDVVDLIRNKVMKMRPGSLSNYYHFAFCFAVALLVAKEIKWCDTECNNAFEQLCAKFPERKLNELGNLAN